MRSPPSDAWTIRTSTGKHTPDDCATPARQPLNPTIPNHQISPAITTPTSTPEQSQGRDDGIACLVDHPTTWSPVPQPPPL
jgi:hypothetical protein